MSRRSKKQYATFGGDWTEQKLRRLGAYLVKYRTIFSQNEKARFFTTVYVDAFASTGSRVAGNASDVDSLPLELKEEETQRFYKGSVRVALDVHPAFDKYLFIELNAQRYTELQEIKVEYPAANIEVVQSDANVYLQKWCAETNWQITRSVVFLDPFGMQVEWNTLKAIAQTKGVDLWLLFPIGMGVMRMLTNSGPPQQTWASRLTSVLGTEDWRNEFYIKQTVQTLFGEEDQEIKDADFQVVQNFFVARLQTIFAGVARNPLILRNSRNVPLYMLCFAASNDKGSGPAIRIAEHLLKE